MTKESAKAPPMSRPRRTRGCCCRKWRKEALMDAMENKIAATPARRVYFDDHGYDDAYPPRRTPVARSPLPAHRGHSGPAAARGRLGVRRLRSDGVESPRGTPRSDHGIGAPPTER